MWPIAGWYALGGITSFGGVLLFDRVFSIWDSIRLAWHFGPWRDLPIPYDQSESDVHLLWPREGFFYTAIPGFLGAVLVVAVLHAATFGVAVFLLAKRGWPPDWQDVRSSLDLKNVWRQSARRTVWIMPAYFLLQQIFGWIASGQGYVWNYAIWNDGSEAPIALCTILVAYFMVNAQALRQEILRLERAESRRCETCGYLLRALTSDRCPECGQPYLPGSVIKFGLGRGAVLPRRPRVRLAIVGAALVAIFSPAWVPQILRSLPLSLVQRLPSSFAGLAHDWRQNCNAFPIRTNCICTVTHNSDQLAVIFREGIGGRPRNRYEWAFWKGNALDRSCQRGESNFGWQEMRIGPWQLRCNYAGPHVVWVNRPDSSYAVSAAMPESAGPRLRAIFAASQPSK